MTLPRSPSVPFPRAIHHRRRGIQRSMADNAPQKFTIVQQALEMTADLRSPRRTEAFDPRPSCSARSPTRAKTPLLPGPGRDLPRRRLCRPRRSSRARLAQARPSTSHSVPTSGCRIDYRTAQERALRRKASSTRSSATSGATAWSSPIITPGPVSDHPAGPPAGAPGRAHRGQAVG